MKTIAILCLIGFFVSVKSEAPECDEFVNETEATCGALPEEPVCATDGTDYRHPCAFCAAQYFTDSTLTYSKDGRC
uniref:Kazal-like domain-containing protein n=1 Tax=Ciona savignyi TaxID=51511 RepID=H2YSC0_CIOSA